jgi:hypothetical protein
MSSIYSIAGGDNALRWLSLSTGLSPQLTATLGGTFPAANLPQGVGQAYSTASGTGTTLSLADSSRLIQVSAAAGSAIVGYLQSLADVASQARAPGYSSELGAQAVTANSRVNLQVQVGSLLAAIDSTAYSAQVNGAGLLTGGSSALTLSTTALGGKVVAAPQPLTTGALGLSGLDVGTNSGAADALARIQSALETAITRNQGLQSLGQLFQDQAAYLSNLSIEYAQSDLGRLSQLSAYGSLGQGQAFGGAARGITLNIVA